MQCDMYGGNHSAGIKYFLVMHTYMYVCTYSTFVMKLQYRHRVQLQTALGVGFQMIPMFVCMLVCACLCVHACVCMLVCVYICVTCKYACVSECMRLHTMCMGIHVQGNACTSVCMYVCVGVPV